MQKYATLLHGLKTELVHLSTKSKATRQMAHIQTNSVAEPQNRKKKHTPLQTETVRNMCI